MKKSILLVVCLSFFLVGCKEERKSYVYFTHPQLMNYRLSHCDKLPVSEARENASCQMAFEQATLLSQYSRSFAANQQQFGSQIIATQMEIAKLESQLESSTQAEAMDLEKQISDLRYKVKKMLFTISLYMVF